MSDEEYMQLAYQQACFARDIDEVPMVLLLLKMARLLQQGISKRISA